MALIEIISGALPLLVPLVGAISGIKFVKEGERGIKLRFGKAVTHSYGAKRGKVKVYHPGIAVVFPAIHGMQKVHVRQNVINCANQTIMLKDRTVFGVSAVITFRVGEKDEDVYNALFEVTGLTKAVENYCMAILRDVIREQENETLISNAQSIAESAAEMATERLRTWGVILESIRLSDCFPDAETARAIQTEMQARFRGTALKTAAEQLSVSIEDLDPGLGAALIGVPVSTAI